MDIIEWNKKYGLNFNDFYKSGDIHISTKVFDVYKHITLLPDNIILTDKYISINQLTEIPINVKCNALYLDFMSLNGLLSLSNIENLLTWDINIIYFEEEIYMCSRRELHEKTKLMLSLNEF